MPAQGDDGFRFRHILIRDAAYPRARQGDARRASLSYSDWLGSAGELDELVGYHLEQAFRYQQELGAADAALGTAAGEHLLRAGGEAVRRGDSPAAVSLLDPRWRSSCGIRTRSGGSSWRSSEAR